LVEQRTENPRVGGSIPSLATIYNKFNGLRQQIGSENGPRHPDFYGTAGVNVKNTELNQRYKPAKICAALGRKVRVPSRQQPAIVDMNALLSG
jgi:hypothetical protein